MGVGEDRISALPDELLHDILVCLRSTRAAACTSVLSRRWRHVWAHLPEVILSGRDAPPPPRVSSLPDSVDAALAAFSATAVLLERLHINIMSCPCLRDLTLCYILVDASDISIHSDSLQMLSFSIMGTQRLEVVTPRLEHLYVGEATGEARISAPKLARVVWCVDTYDPHRHQFEGVGRRLRLLDICGNFIAGLLMQRFDEVDKLNLGIYNPHRIEPYERFFSETNKLPKCKTLSITLENHHGLAPVMLHLPRSCGGAKKVSVQLIDPSDYTMCCWASCPCRSEENRKIDGIDLNSLEELEITSYKSFEKELLKFMEQLSRCNAPILKKLVYGHRMFQYPSHTKVVYEKVRSMYHPKIEVECYEFLDGMWVRFD
ncbi:unnamed protein product [Urochloa decumbens]|uniref:F-box domain-containing protein n=1 Tax=Urochloa decumbens TaxID=240449 RepID=A0ABC9B3I9_9POAL